VLWGREETWERVALRAKPTWEEIKGPGTEGGVTGFDEFRRLVDSVSKAPMKSWSVLWESGEDGVPSDAKWGGD
jgi:hypothetical protein